MAATFERPILYFNHTTREMIVVVGVVRPEAIPARA
jgi:hypothetical protein